MKGEDPQHIMGDLQRIDGMKLNVPNTLILAAGPPGPAESTLFTLPSYSDTADDHQECRSLSHLGILMPLYLLPLLFLGAKAHDAQYGGCIYCLLLPLLLWAFNSLPKPGAALVHMVTVPLMGLLEPEQIAHQYLSVQALTLALMLSLVVVIDRWSDLALHLALSVSKRFGLRRGRLFVALCLCCFVCASLFSGVVVSAALLYMLHRVLFAIFKQDMDRPQEVVVPPTSGVRGGSVLGSLQETSSMRSAVATGDQVLFERLTQVVSSMQKPVGTLQTSATAPLNVETDLDVPGKSASSAAERPTADGSGAIRHADATAEQADTPFTEPGTGASTNEAPQTLVRVEVTDEGGAFDPITPFAARKKNESLECQRPPEMHHHLSVNSGLRTGDKPRMSQSMAGGTLDKRQDPGRQGRGLSLLFRRASSMRPWMSKESEVSTPITQSKKRSRFMGSIGAIAGFFTRKRFSETQPKHPDEQAVHAHDQPASILQAGTKRHVAENEPKPNADRLAATNVPSAVGRSGTSTEYRAPHAGPLLVTRSEQYPGTSKTAVVQSRRALSDIVPTATITDISRATEARGPLIAATKLGGPNLPAYTPAAVPATVRGKHAPSVSPECSSVLPKKRAGQESVARGCMPITPNEVQNSGPVTTKADVEASGGRKGDNTADDKSGGKPVHEETRERSCEANEDVDTAADAVVTKGKLKAKIKASRGTEPEGKKAHSKSPSDKDTTATSKKRKRSGKKSRDSTSGSRRQSPRSKSRTSIRENTQDSRDMPEKEEQMQSKRSDPASPTKEGQQPITKPSNAAPSEIKEKPDSGSQSASAPTTETEQLSVVASGKSRCGRSTEGLEPVQQPVQSDSTKVSPSSSDESGRDSVQQKTIRSIDSSDPQNSSHMYKSPVKHRQNIGTPAVKSRVKKTKQSTVVDITCPDRKEISTKKGEPLEEQSRSRLHAAETEKQPQSCEMPKALETTAVRESEKVLEASKSNEPEKAASSASTSRDRGSKSVTSRTPPVQEVQHAPTMNSVSVRNARRASWTGLQTPRRKQSVVSFGAGIREAAVAFNTKPVPQEVPKALAHLEEMAPKYLPRRNLATILKASRSTTLPRAEPSVDFGDAHFAMISDRADVHNAFLLGPSLMTMLGNICNFHTGGNRSSLKTVSEAFEATAEESVSTSAWAMVTLPGAILTFILCTTILWLIYLRPYDQEPLSPENLAVMKAARERSAARGRQRGVQCAYATYLVIFSLSYTPALIWDMEPRSTKMLNQLAQQPSLLMWQLRGNTVAKRRKYFYLVWVYQSDRVCRMAIVVALASAMLVTSVLTSCLRAAFDFLRHVWQMLPWGVILMLGATQVASKLLQAHGLLIESFKLIPASFWEERTALELQAMMAFAASVMAETTDKQVLVEIMTPMVVHIADMKRTYAEYYAIPLIVGASSNCIMPASVPFAILHGLTKVTFFKLLLLGLFAKIVIISTVITTVNMVDRFGYFGSQAHAD
ncbi:hypothetical protein HPB52_005759 [Rhipicephalus sanguineus]|uniref:Citrate transporter-like domain-containing protein n=1 Tax=Rhipicephalus sanguineus TaxID=34632 RepID=A0A9D4PUU1_RHISA|nr:hypothetical protein HPB52_005759 [Rhipicephalus sanguineus]